MKQKANERDVYKLHSLQATVLTIFKILSLVWSHTNEKLDSDLKILFAGENRLLLCPKSLRRSVECGTVESSRQIVFRLPAQRLTTDDPGPDLRPPGNGNTHA